MNKIIKGKNAVDIFSMSLDKDNFILFHGTTAKNAESIMKTGLKMERVTTVTTKPETNPLTFASYAWKDILPRESVNVIVEIPIKKIWGNILKGYDIDNWINKLRESNEEELFTRTLLECEKDAVQISFFDEVPTILPNYFIRGYVRLDDRNDYYLLPEQVDEDKINFIENDNYFSNLGLVEQQQIINKYRNKYQNK